VRVNGGILRRLLIAVASISIAFGVIFAVLLWAIEQERAAVRDSSEAPIASAAELERLAIDLETGQRGFLLTGQEWFLQPALAARARYPGVLAALQRESHFPGQVAALGSGIESYLAMWFDRIVPLARRDRAAARRLAATGEGKRRTDALRAQFDRLIGAERRWTAQARADAGRDAGRATAIAIAGGALAVALMFLVAAYLARSFALPTRRVAAAAGRLAQGDLTARLPATALRAPGEVGELARAFNRMAAALEESRDELEAQNTELETQQEALAETATELEAQQEQLELTVDELEREKRHLEVLHRFGELIVEETRVGPLSDRLLREICDAADAEVGVLYAAEPERPDVMRLAAVRGVQRTGLPAVLGADEGLAGRAVAERRAVEAAHGATGLRVRALGDEVTVRHELHIPLLQAGATVGVVTLARASGAAFSAAERDLVDRLAAQGSVALANALALSKVSRREAINAAVLDATPDAIGLFDTDGEPVMMNGPMRRLVAELGDGITSGAIDDSEDMTHDELAAGERRFERYCTFAHDASSTTVGRLVVLRDVTAEREAERLKDEFFALVSHELRTPLTSILGYVELLLELDGDDPADPRRRRFLDIVERNARRLLRLVGDLLFVAQVEAGRLSLERREVDLAALARECVDAARPRAAAAEIELTVSADSAPPTAGDPDRLAQAVDNLISNALKFTPAGGAVTVRLRVRGDRAAIEVADTGPGIPDDEHERLFERFFRARQATDEAIPGVGLGLAIVKAIVDAHGGAVSVESHLGAGTTFHIELPLVPPPSRGDGVEGGATQEAIGDHRT
jgi:signal transduction histidine kinase/CHASE3 domain sensor protein